MKYVVTLLIVMVLVMGSLAARPLWAQSQPALLIESATAEQQATLPLKIEVRPTMCPCELVLLDAPRGVSGMVAEFTDRLATVVGSSLIGAGGSANPSSTSWIFVPGVTSTVNKVTKREIWQASWTDTLDEIGLGSTDVVLLTYNIPLTADLTSLKVDDDDGNIIVSWP